MLTFDDKGRVRGQKTTKTRLRTIHMMDVPILTFLNKSGVILEGILNKISLFHFTF